MLPAELEEDEEDEADPLDEGRLPLLPFALTPALRGLRAAALLLEAVPLWNRPEGRRPVPVRDVEEDAGLEEEADGLPVEGVDADERVDRRFRGAEARGILGLLSCLFVGGASALSNQFFFSATLATFRCF